MRSIEILNRGEAVNEYWKAHGLGNDYLVLDCLPSEQNNKLVPARVQKVCDRHRGLGSDGILEPRLSQRADVGVCIWNPDGSVAEKSGNGLRIFAWWWVMHRNQAAPNISFTVDTGTDVVSCVVDPERGWVDVQMGRARFEPLEIPTTDLVWARTIMLDGEKLTLYAMGIGNPHCVVFVNTVDELDSIPWRKWGAVLEKHPLFPNRTNVQFACVINPQEIEIRIWERGAGETEASGSSSCAVACIAHKLGKVGPEVTMQMPGGLLEVAIAENWHVQLRGPVEEVAQLKCLF